MKRSPVFENAAPLGRQVALRPFCCELANRLASHARSNVLLLALSSPLTPLFFYITPVNLETLKINPSAIFRNSLQTLKYHVFHATIFIYYLKNKRPMTQRGSGSKNPKNFVQNLQDLNFIALGENFPFLKLQETLQRD